MIEAVTDTSKEGGVTEDLRMHCERAIGVKGRKGGTLRGGLDFAHVYARGSHPQSAGGQSEVSVCDGKVNRSSWVVKSVDGRACSCRGI